MSVTGITQHILLSLRVLEYCLPSWACLGTPPMAEGPGFGQGPWQRPATQGSGQPGSRTDLQVHTHQTHGHEIH